MDFRVNLYRKQTVDNKANQLVDDGKRSIEGKNQSIQDENQSFEEKNQSIGNKNQLIEKQKQLIYSIDGNSGTKENAWMVFEKLHCDTIFGRVEIMEITGLSTSAAGILINKLKDAKLIIPVSGKGKGKYIFKIEV